MHKHIINLILNYLNDINENRVCNDLNCKSVKLHNTTDIKVQNIWENIWIEELNVSVKRLILKFQNIFV